MRCVDRRCRVTLEVEGRYGPITNPGFHLYAAEDTPIFAAGELVESLYAGHKIMVRDDGTCERNKYPHLYIMALADYKLAVVPISSSELKEKSPTLATHLRRKERWGTSLEDGMRLTWHVDIQIRFVRKLASHPVSDEK